MADAFHAHAMPNAHDDHTRCDWCPYPVGALAFLLITMCSYVVAYWLVVCFLRLRDGPVYARVPDDERVATSVLV